MPLGEPSPPILSVIGLDMCSEQRSQLTSGISIVM